MQVSAFVDGELPDNEADLLVRRLSQDAKLRQQVAEFLAIGRVIRGEHAWTGVDELRSRIAAELEDTTLSEDGVSAVPEARSGWLRPLAGVAIAATVALVAIFGLRQTVGVNADVAESALTAQQGQPETVPAISDADEELRRFMLMYGDASEENGANSFKMRWTAAQIRADELDAGDIAAEEAGDEAETDSADDTDPVNSTP